MKRDQAMEEKTLHEEVCLESGDYFYVHYSLSIFGMKETITETNQGK